MTHWTSPRGLRTDLRLLTAARLHAIALELEADHAAAVMANLEAAADPTPWPTTTGGAGSSSRPGSPVELAIIAPNPTSTTARAARLLAALGHLVHLAATIDPGLAEWSPARTIARCPNPGCGEPLRPDKRCPKCSTREGARLVCDDCGKEDHHRGLRPWPPTTWTGYTDGVARVLCWKDYKWRHRHDGRPAASIDRLALGDGVLVDEEATG